MGSARLLLLPLDVQLCHRLASQVSSGTLWLHRRRCSPVPYAGQPSWRRRCQRFPLLLPALPDPLLLTGDTGSRCPIRGDSSLAVEGTAVLQQCTAEPQALQLPSVPPPFAELTSCHVNHTANWQAGASWIINLPLTNLPPPPHPIFAPVVKL